nr:FAD-dependent oxidoreductase domain-containing protein 2 [Ciona intestinalis]|eukprot:XP_002127179.2 FAD-dependent oxidoreductase domain-containing protein 2 [Ciona intestinalis]
MQVSVFVLVLFCLCLSVYGKNKHEGSIKHDDPMLNTETPNYKEYCVIGAGPGGLQIAYYLESSERDYIVFEKGHGAGTFYNKFPIHRKLISLNKVYTGKTNKEFNMRHDWNSLLSNDESLLMTKYSEEFFPPADVLVQYLNDYATKLNLKVQYNSTMHDILKRKDGLFQMWDQHNNAYTCKYVIVATGIAKPNHIDFPGSDLTVPYEDLTLDLKPYEGKNVWILGRGNSAYEVAQHIMGVTNFIAMMAKTRTRLAWATHYVGDLRAINNDLLDNYQLKSLDGLFEGDVTVLNLKRSNLTGRIYTLEPGSDRDTIPGGKDVKKFQTDPTRRGFDHVITCLGFKFDDSIFHPSIKLRKSGRSTSKGKYPLISPMYESLDVRNLYFAGTNTHSLDWRKSAGGFIHGYRYTVRTLHRIMEWTHHGVQWPAVKFSNPLDLLPHVLKRVNEASDIYQMFSEICDVIIFGEDKISSEYLESFPCPLVSILPHVSGHKVPGSVMVLSMEYGKNFSGVGKDVFHGKRAARDPREGHKASLLHPVIYYYGKLFTTADHIHKHKQWVLPVPDRIVSLIEEFTTKFDAERSHVLMFRRFIEDSIGVDMRHWFANQCLKLSLTETNIPLGCQTPSLPAVTDFISNTVNATPTYQQPLVELDVTNNHRNYIKYLPRYVTKLK